MPRTARIKTPVSMYHIMARSISEISLFKDDIDRDKYLFLIKKYQEIYLFKIYAYCIMTTHLHLIVDCSGADISRIMKSINQSYAAYYNRKYTRHGHVFQDRFKSKIIDDDRYLRILSAYIHNNPDDPKRPNKILNYKYSSLGIYLGKFSSPYKILDCSFILSQYSENTIKARKIYINFMRDVYKMLPSDTNIENFDFDFSKDTSQYIDGRSILIRDISTEDIIEFIQTYTGASINIHIKYIRKHMDLKSICVLLMRSLCNFTLKRISNYLGNMTISNIHRLNDRAYKLITENDQFKDIVRSFLNAKKSAIA